MKKIIPFLCVALIAGFFLSSSVTVNGNCISIVNAKSVDDTLESQIKAAYLPTEFSTDYATIIWNDKDTTLYDHISLSDYLLRKDITVSFSINVDKDKLFEEIDIYDQNATPSNDAYIKDNKIVPEQYGTQIDKSKLYYAIINKEYKKLSDYYKTPKVLSDDLKPIIEQYETKKAWHGKYADGIEISVPDNAVQIDESYHVVTNDDFLDDIITQLEAKYDNIGKDHEFVTHSGETITVSGGTWGTLMDSAAEKEFLQNAFASNESFEERTPILKQDSGTITDSYIEVNKNEQHLYLYKNGELVLESDVVTGTLGKKDTPTGVFYISEYMPGKYLRPQGSSSATWVNRWMRITPDGVGLHDATWRGRFGGNIYKTSGSHGCINLPKSKAYEIYDLVCLGYPVIVY